MTEKADRQSMTSSSCTHSTRVYNAEPTDHEKNIADESTFIPLPLRLPPLTVPTYPSQVPTLSSSLNAPHPSTNLTDKCPSAMTTPQQLQPAYAVPPSRSVTDYSRISYGYNSNVSFPARPPNQRIGESSGPTNDRADNARLEESLVSAVSNYIISSRF